jgi:hypothetical protein
MILNRNPVLCSTSIGGGSELERSKQDIVAVSMTKTDYIIVFDAPKEVVWIRHFVSEWGIVPSASSPLDLYCDNCGAIAQEKEPTSHKRSKHVLQHYHLIHKIID